MMRSLWSAASGMKAQQTNMDIVAHNIANVDTYGNKKVRAEFQDLLYQTLRDAGGTSGNGTQFPQGLQIGLGVKVAATHRVFTQGPLQTTDNPSDVGIQGDGFFQVQLPDGSTAYTRDGSFKLDSQRRLVTSDGYLLIPNITLDENAPLSSVVISSDGRVSDTPAGADATQQEIGQITLVRFVNPEGLYAYGKNLFLQTEASGEPIESEPGQDGAGVLAQNTLEMSGVQIVEEMVNMIVSQRAYESNAKAVTTSDSMLETANQLKR
ncbi:MAG: flagellar basal-body rod protein FlgG [Selenomonadaceae bacterium]|nr:flagellar basal-body rod protein FlgG [Selenomonadaceae bacterium]